MLGCTSTGFWVVDKGRGEKETNSMLVKAAMIKHIFAGFFLSLDLYLHIDEDT